MLDLLIVLLVVAAVAWLVLAPLRSSAVVRVETEESAERADLEAAKEAKYREIRDAEMDRRTGKLSDADWRVLDRDLRAEAVAILRRIDALEGHEGGETPLRPRRRPAPVERDAARAGEEAGAASGPGAAPRDPAGPLG